MRFPEYIEQDLNPPKEYFEEEPNRWYGRCSWCGNDFPETDLMFIALLQMNVCEECRNAKDYKKEYIKKLKLNK